MNKDSIRSLEHMKLLRVEDNGAGAEIGLGFAGAIGGRARASTDSINTMAEALLCMGHPLHAAGAPAADFKGSFAASTIIQCSQLAVAALPDGRAALVLGFGPLALRVAAPARDIRQALDLLEAASLGQLHQAPPGQPQ